jgi:hypothetical protein
MSAEAGKAGIPAVAGKAAAIGVVVVIGTDTDRVYSSA